jgi:hypothetical protein
MHHGFLLTSDGIASLLLCANSLDHSDDLRMRLHHGTLSSQRGRCGRLGIELREIVCVLQHTSGGVAQLYTSHPGAGQRTHVVLTLSLLKVA